MVGCKGLHIQLRCTYQSCSTPSEDEAASSILCSGAQNGSAEGSGGELLRPLSSGQNRRGLRASPPASATTHASVKHYVWCLNVTSSAREGGCGYGMVTKDISALLMRGKRLCSGFSAGCYYTFKTSKAGTQRVRSE
jgi:hypothetical protein